ncbi:MFS transporter [Paludibacterium sp. THUN1379]|nr:MFS transporter [Paludibacterium sp. THUN1379]
MLPLACLVVLMAQMATTLYLPSLPEVMHALSMTQAQAELSISLFVISAALPLLWWGRAAERWGRRRSLQGALLLFMASSLALAFCHEAWQLLFLRGVQGMSAGGAAIIARILVRDFWQGDALARRLSCLSMAFICALGGGQFVGGLIARFGRWPQGFVLMALLALLAFCFGHWLPATHSRGHPAPMWHGLWCLLRRAGYWQSAAVGGVGYAVIVTLQQCSPFVFRQDFGLGATGFGALGVLFALCYLAGSVLVHRMVPHYGSLHLLRRGCDGLLLAGLAIFVWMAVMSHEGRLGLVVFVLLYGLAVFGQAVVFPNSMALAVEQGRDQGGMAMALCGFVQQVLAGVFALSAVWLNHIGGWAAAVCLLAVLAWWLARSGRGR